MIYLLEWNAVTAGFEMERVENIPQRTVYQGLC
jgi:hypothetical protein